jgi:hypothetical protein
VACSWGWLCCKGVASTCNEDLPSGRICQQAIGAASYKALWLVYAGGALTRVGQEKKAEPNDERFQLGGTSHPHAWRVPP